MAHHQPQHLLRLIRALASPNAFFFIHVDVKSPIAPFEAIAREPRTAIIGNRVEVNWGGYSQVRATRYLLAAALRSAPKFIRYTLLSGADFSVKPRTYIERVLMESDREFLQVHCKLSGSPRNEHFDSIERFYLNDNTWCNKRLHSRYRLTQRFAARAFDVGRRILPRRRYIPGFAPYKGSQWWSLTDACIRHVLAFLDANPEYERFHQTVHAPDEIFFHSIIKASPFAAKISHDFEAGALGNDCGLHYIDWNARDESLPKVLDISDLPALLRSNALFARKFDPYRSAELLNELERRNAEELP